MNLEFKLLSPDAFYPTRATKYSAGWDLYVPRGTIVTVPEGQWTLAPTDVAVSIPDGYVGLLTPRSGLSSKFGLSIVNSPGIIDSDYRGELKVILINHGNMPFKAVGGDRIAQLVIMPYLTSDAIFVDSLPETERGENGFGSTGR